MNCEICGQLIRGKPITAIVDGAKLVVCEECCKYSSGRWSVNKPKAQTKVSTTSTGAQTKPQTGLAFEKTKRKERAGEEFEVIEKYGGLIRQAREKIGLSYEELGKRINEKVSVIQRLESQRLVPDAKLAKKLEYALKIKLLREAEIPAVSKEDKGPSETTLGDIVTIKHKKSESGG